mmetsp:Transcript_15058/g.23299  ORF Transcript_15058/g.23299 Transcript_15058/m.23299 type:complete len:163 (-) Transcript_15058:1885-2373(-)
MNTYNVDEMMGKWDDFIAGYRENFATNEIMVLWGGDFQWYDAEMFYNSLDRMIHYINEHYKEKYTLKYSTVSDYIDAIHKLDHTWPVKTEDMFPYSDKPANYWTGYFTSRALAKGEVRRGSYELHASSQLYAMSMLRQGASNETIEANKLSTYGLFDAMGIY